MKTTILVTNWVIYALLAVIVVVVILAMIKNAQVEETSLLFNCHWHGNQICGTTDGLFGFVAL